MLTNTDFKSKASQAPNIHGKIKVKVLVIGAVLVIGLVFTQLVFANSLATDGQKLAQINQEISKLEAENTSLKVDISQESSLTSLSKKANELGFKKPSKLITP